MFACRSGRHHWLSPVSAERCCDPQWQRVLRAGAHDLQPGDDEDGQQPISDMGGWLFVWRRVDAE